MTLDDLLDKLEGVRAAGNGFNAICPAHEDREASLNVAETEDRLLVKCYAGCSTADVLDQLELHFSDLFTSSTNYAEPEAIYSYTDESGHELFQSVRFPGKKFRQRQKGDEPGEWIWDLDGVRRVLYRLPEVLQAVHERTTVYIVEGEKDAERLRSLGKVATCNPMGAGKWREEYAQALYGGFIIVVVDRDEAGRKHAAMIRESLEGRVEQLKFYQAAQGKDVSDHLDAGYQIEQLVEYKEHRLRAATGIITARQLAQAAREDLFLKQEDLPGFELIPGSRIVLRQGRMYALGAYTGEGKTTVALQLTRSLAMAKRRVGYFSLEMTPRDLRNRLIAHHGVPLSALEEPWLIASNPIHQQRYDAAVAELEDWHLDIDFNSGATAEHIAETTRDRDYEVVVVDHIHRFAWGDRRQLEHQVTKLTNLALDLDITLLVLCQLRKFSRGKDFQVYPRPTRDDFRETSQIADDASMAFAIWRQRADDGRTYVGTTELIVLKNRHTTGRHDQTGHSLSLAFDETTQLFAANGGT